MAKETFGGVKEITKAVQAGQNSKASLTCQGCLKQNPSNSKFCNECGKSLVQICGKCNHENVKDARFCNDCGSSF
ncbi:double zinc ribbon domain-containing protein [Halalkalibacter akibai]|uniref:DZANK-type domain-containing protein n=1 Tax=Halalkalibacter akibai (strain ATCC 43226 / DSM 21942 / CIP 109018 / JCM 9157 / 1139) TaxID=1236973 RepID=W4QV00_HALA3|nr:hypothetical protein JCM9157_2260 [Halalkalibacter akibai JCM 9157]